MNDTHTLPPPPEQAGWGVEMHGQIVLFASNVVWLERANGMSPGATTALFTADQLRTYAAEYSAPLRAEIEHLTIENKRFREAGVKLESALDRIDYLLGEPNDMGVSAYCLDRNEDRVVQGVERLTAALAQAQEDARRDAESRCMFVARLEKRTEACDQWLTTTAVLALLNDCDMLASRDAAIDAAQKEKP